VSLLSGGWQLPVSLQADVLARVLGIRDALKLGKCWSSRAGRMWLVYA